MEDLSKYNLTLTRSIKAPLDRVWQAWTDPGQLKQWWGPEGVSCPECQWEVKPGADVYVVMKAGEQLGELAGQRWPMTGYFIEVVPMKKLVYRASPLVEDQAIMDTENEVTFEEEGDGTKLTLRIKVTRITDLAAGPLSGMEIGWSQSLDKLVRFSETSA